MSERCEIFRYKAKRFDTAGEAVATDLALSPRVRARRAVLLGA